MLRHVRRDLVQLGDLIDGFVHGLQRLDFDGFIALLTDFFNELLDVCG